MNTPEGPHIETTYGKDGSLTRAPKGYGGGLCNKATQPYEWRQGGKEERTVTDEANQPEAVRVKNPQTQENA